ncbi:MAG: 2,3-bisphosphoglycerate-independent phosphoglycerate mutase [Pseudomonadota bacterium]
MTQTVPKPPRPPTVLLILDGWGLRDATEGNAVAQAATPHFDRLMALGPATTLTACGNAVGLPEGQMGNSEVGHTNIGAGRIVWMDLPRIDAAIETGEFQKNVVLQSLAAKATAAGGSVHLAGLASPGGVHSHQRHIAEAARALAAHGLTVHVHAFLDGRDVAPKSAGPQLAELDAALPPGAALATLCGRFYAMDRDNRWDRVAQAASLLLAGKGARHADAGEALAAAYAAEESDEFDTPRALADYPGMAEGDALLFLNFRADRARELLHALIDPAFDAFDPGPRPALSAIAGLVEYSADLARLMPAMFPPQDIANTLGQWLSRQNRTQLRLAETEKYPHVTFFLNGGEETPRDGETRHMAPSPNVRTYDAQPEMAEPEVTHRLVEAIRSGKHDLIVCNYANPDMVGHTGDLAAAVAACEAVDRGLGKALAALEKSGGAMIVTADHGNCETMIDPDAGGPHTAHTLNPVPCLLVGGPPGARLRDGGVLGDLAPTVLELMGLPQPPEMTGRSLLIRTAPP